MGEYWCTDVRDSRSTLGEKRSTFQGKIQPAAMRELEKIEMTRRNGNEYQLDFTLTKTQKAILRSFGLDEEEVKKRTAAYRERLRTVDDRIQPDNEAEDEEDAQAEKFEDC